MKRGSLRPLWSGADSLCMARTLREYQKSIDPAVKILAAHVRIPRVALPDSDLQIVENYLSDLRIPLSVIRGDVSEDKSFSCYACVRERRKRLFQFAAGQGISTVAFGHNFDDYLKTGFMNLVHGGHLESLQPKQSMFGDKIIVIRPLLAVSKKQINQRAKELKLPRLSTKCAYAMSNRRVAIHSVMIDLQRLNRAFRPNLRRVINVWNDQSI